MAPSPAVLADGKRIRELRYDRRLTTTALGRKIGRHPKTIQRVEHGRRGASPILLRDIADGLGVDWRDLVCQAPPGQDGEPDAAQDGTVAA